MGFRKLLPCNVAVRTSPREASSQFQHSNRMTREPKSLKIFQVSFPRLGILRGSAPLETGRALDCVTTAGPDPVPPPPPPLVVPVLDEDWDWATTRTPFISHSMVSFICRQSTFRWCQFRVGRVLYTSIYMRIRQT